MPSIDTLLCEEQTHLLSESPILSPRVARIVISRDTPMAKKRFAGEVKLDNLEFACDFKYGAFGKKAGLLLKGPELLARAVLVLDKDMVVRHLQVNSELTKLPDMNAAFAVANRLERSNTTKDSTAVP